MGSCRNLNEIWSAAITSAIAQAGISYCCLGYGSRSTPLVLSLLNEPSIQTYHHFDERGLAFHALGYAKAAKQPTAIVVTSGSAVANLYPAVMEAFEEEIPLLIITADRPSEFKCMGSNQTTSQARIFSSHVVWQFDFPPPDSCRSIRKMIHLLSYSLSKLDHPGAGPVHINCMFREPLEYSSKEKIRNFTIPKYFSPKQCTDPSHTRARDLPWDSPGIILAGYMENKQDQEAVLLLAKTLKWPLFVDITSNMRGLESSELIPFYDILLSTDSAKKLEPSIILHFGGKMVSKRLLNWIENLPFISYIHVSSSVKNYNPHYRLTHRFYIDAYRFCNLLPLTPTPSSTTYLKEWISLSAIVAEKLETFYKTKEGINEIQLPLCLSKLDWDYSLFFANSMPIRDADMFFSPRKPIAVFANRGVSGIDGNIASAIGIATSMDKPLIAILGDLASLHDLNSLLQINSSAPVLYIIVNNGGGGIFSFLPIAKATSKATLDKGFAASHEYCFLEFSKALKYLYFSPSSPSELEESILMAQKKSISAIIEIKSVRPENYALHQQFLSEMNLATASVEAL